MRKIHVLCICALSLLAAYAPLAGASPTISPDELVRGQKGYGLSVFAGSEPERFEVEVLGVLRNTSPEMSYILARLLGQNLEESGVVGGMSGSPVYFDGRLAGAVAFSYLFGIEAIAGITPIDAMRRLSEIAPSEGGARTPAAAGPGTAEALGLAVTLDQLVERSFEPDRLEKALAALARPSSVAGAPPALQWTASGFGRAATSLLERTFAGLAPAGIAMPAAGAPAAGAPVMTGSVGGTIATAEDLTPGSSVAAVLVEGDLNLAAHGTVTDRDGPEVLAFGHPVFSLGPVNLPMAPSEVVTVISSVFNSFKVSNAGPVIGAFDQDRQAGVRGRLGATAPTTPLRVALRGLAQNEYRMSITNLPQLRPLLIAISTLGALSSGSYAGGSQGLDLEARFAIAGHDDLVVRQSFDGDQAGSSGAIYLLSFAAYLDFNELAEVALDRVDVELTQVERPRSATLVAAHAARRRVEPGSTVPVTLELQAYRGERFRRQIEVAIPDQVPDGKYYVLLGDGTSMDVVRMAVEPTLPMSFEQSLAVLRSLHSRRELVVLGLIPGAGLTMAGEALPGLPGSMRSIFAASPTPATAPLTLTIVHQQLDSLDSPIEGAVRIDLEVKRDRT